MYSSIYFEELHKSDGASNQSTQSAVKKKEKYQKTRSDLETYLFVFNGVQANGEKLRRLIPKIWYSISKQEHFRWSDQRHAWIAFQVYNMKSIKANIPVDEDENDVMDEQAGHSTKTARRFYARDNMATFGIHHSKLTDYQVISNEWHTLLGLTQKQDNPREVLFSGRPVQEPNAMIEDQLNSYIIQQNQGKHIQI